MNEQDTTTMMAMMVNMTKDVGDIKTSMAVNTLETQHIQEHLKTLNGRMLKQEEHLAETDKTVDATKKIVDAIVTVKKRWDDGFTGFLKQLLIIASAVVSAGLINHLFK